MNKATTIARLFLAAAASLACGPLAHAIDFESFEFNDPTGTELMNAQNTANPGNQWFSTNEGADMLPSDVRSGAYRVIKDLEGLSSNYLQIDNITGGTAYLTVTMTGWKFTGPDLPDNPEQVRFAFLDNDTGDSGATITAQMQVRRNVDTGEIELVGDAIGTAGSFDIAGVAPLATEQTQPFTMVLALDQDSDSFEVFYKDGSNPSQSLGLGGTSRVRDGNSLRFAVNNNLGSTNFFPTVIDEQFNIDSIVLSDTNPLTDLMTLEVNRDTGAMTLTNTSGAPVTGIESYSITSLTGALNASEWRTIAGNEDANGTGDFDNNGVWGIDSDSPIELGESVMSGGLDGGELGVGQSLVLDVSPASTPGPWLQNPVEDVDMVLTLTGGATRTVNVDFVGNGGQKWLIGDLNFDGGIDTADWTILITNAETDLSALSTAQAYQRGDLDGDGVNGVVDFGLFKDAFNTANGPGSFEAMLAAVPEPSAAAMSLVAALCCACSRRRRQPQESAFTPNDERTINKAAVTRLLCLLAVAGALAARPVHAGVLEDFQFNDAAGTDLPSVANSANPGNQFDEDTDTSLVTTNGMGQLNASLKSNTGFGSNYIDIDPGISSGTLYGVFELTWEFDVPSFDAGEPEELRLTFVNNEARGTQVTAQVEIERTDANTLEINGTAIGTGASDLPTTQLSLSQTERFIAVLAADLDNDTYEVQYSDNNGASYGTLGMGNINVDRGLESLRLVLNNDLSQDNILIDRFYLTDENPINVDPDLLKLRVNTTTGVMTLINDTSSTFDIDYYRISSTDDSLNFAGWNSLSDQEFGAIDGGDDIGETWDEAGGSDDGVLSESFLLSSSVFNPDDSVSLGQAFKLGGSEDSLEFQYRDAATGGLFTGALEFLVGLNGDYNDDGVVDAVDFAVWRDNLGAPAGTLPNDPNGGQIGAAQYDTWRANYGAGAGGAVGATGGVIPEPASLALFVLGVVASCRASRRTRRRAL